MKVVFTPVTDYAAVVESLATRKLDLAWLGGFTFVQAKIRTNGTAIPIVQREEDAKFTSKFITANPAIKTLADLKGKSFAFGAPSSTDRKSTRLNSSHLVISYAVFCLKKKKKIAKPISANKTIRLLHSSVLQSS